MKVDKDKAIQDLLDSRDEEYINGMKSMLQHLQKEATCCRGHDDCLICQVGKKFLKRRIKEIQQTGKKEMVLISKEDLKFIFEVAENGYSNEVDEERYEQLEVLISDEVRT